MTIRILTVCTGNICRSPLAAQLLAARLDPGRFSIASGGTSALIGHQMPEDAQRIATRMGVSGVENHRGTALAQSDLVRADLVLAMAREHRRHVARLQPHIARRAFTLLEFGHVVSHLRDEHLAELLTDNSDAENAALTVATRLRGTVPRLGSEDRYDVADPYGRSKQVFERSSQHIEAAVNQIVNFFHRAREIAAARN